MDPPIQDLRDMSDMHSCM